MGHLLAARYFARCWAFSGGLEKMRVLSHEANIEGIQTSNKRTNETVSESEISSQDHQTRRSEAEQLDGNIPTSEMRVVCRTSRCTGSEKHRLSLLTCQIEGQWARPQMSWLKSRLRVCRGWISPGPWRPWWGSSCILNPVWDAMGEFLRKG